MQWDFAQAGHLSPQELTKLCNVVKEAEEADSPGPVQLRRLAFGARNNLAAEHLRMLAVFMDRHPKVSASLDVDWRMADEACLKALAVVLRKRERCALLGAGGDSYGVNTLQLPTNASPAAVETLADLLTTCHPEVDAIAFNLAGAAQHHTVKGTPVVALTPLRMSSQELVLRRCIMGDLGTVAVCAFVRPWAARIQVIRLTECEIGDEGGVALAKLLVPAGPALRELCLTNNYVADRGISEIAKALPMCDCLERLLLDRNNIGDEGAKALGEHLLRSNVQELTLGSHLGGNPIGEEGVEALAAILDDELPRAAANRSGRLSSLNLEGCCVGDRGAQAIAAYLPKSAIMALSMARGNLDDIGAQAIIEALPKTCLSLDLSSNGLSDRSATAVAEVFYRIPQLAVSLANNRLSVGLRTILHEEHGSRLRL